MLFLFYVLIRSHVDGVKIIDAESFYEYIITIIDPITVIIAIFIIAFAIFCLFNVKENFDIEKCAIRSIVIFVLACIIILAIILFIPKFLYREKEADEIFMLLLNTMSWMSIIVYSFITLILIIVRGCKKGIKIIECMKIFVAFELVVGVLAILIVISMFLLFGIIFIPTILTCFEGGSTYRYVSKEEEERRRLEDREIELTLIAEMLDTDDD